MTLSQDEIKRIAREENARYHREYRKKNPEKIRAINARYRAKKKLEDMKQHER